jgi:hypothetical protein
MARGPLAGAAGPGKFSKRTDMDLGSIAYGEGKETSDLSTAAAKSKTRGIADNVGGRPAKIAQTPITPLFADHKDPDEPITTGSIVGEGAGPEALMMQSQLGNRKLSDILAEMIPFDNTGEIAILYQDALSRGN